jgi:A/G-specific adenine glycosylase
MQRMDLRSVRDAVVAWYSREHRDFPWRGLTDPYAVLVSEVMLQQTQASRIAERFPRFMARFPTARSLADAPQSAVLAEWSGLGYNRRALALQRAATHVARHGWPVEVAALERLPGIGPYTARAVASLAFSTPVGVVDTNVRRWLVRRFGVEDRPAALQRLADRLAAHGGDAQEIAAWTHATMELGARVCTARAPRCAMCPIATDCPSRNNATAIPIGRQAPFNGSTRAHRGALLRALSTAARHTLPESAARNVVTPPHYEPVVAAFERDGLVHRSGGELVLGGPLSAATIAE